MHRQYFRVFKRPINFKLINSSLSLKDRNIHTVFRSSPCLNQLHSGLSPLHTGLALSSTLTRSAFSVHIDKKYFSQQNSETKNVILEQHSSAIQLEIPRDNVVELEGQVSQCNLFEDIDYDAITEGDEEKLNKFKLLMLEIDVLRQDGMMIPSKITTEDWKELFAAQTKSQRRKFLNFLFKTEMKKLADKRKKEVKRLARLEELSEEKQNRTSPSDHLEYGFRGSTICLRIYDTTINFFDNYRLIRAMMFGQDLIIDCGFENEMNSMENKLCCKQLVYLFAENRISKEPFNLHFCNLKKDGVLFNLLKKNIPTIDDPAYPINVYEKHYLEMFPKEKLVYLTPHCRTELNEFNHDDIYIVGAIVDRVNTQPMSLAKAKSEGLRMAQLPLDRYLDWGLGNKSLTVNQVINIMHDAQVTRDWNVAFKHVPKRKVRLPGEPIKDRRKPWKRGTVLQPPKRFNNYY